MNYITLNLYWISLLEPLNSVLPSHSFPLTPSQLVSVYLNGIIERMRQ